MTSIPAEDVPTGLTVLNTTEADRDTKQGFFADTSSFMLEHSSSLVVLFCDLKSSIRPGRGG